jgi:hypothetical protein
MVRQEFPGRPPRFPREPAEVVSVAMSTQQQQQSPANPAWQNQQRRQRNRRALLTVGLSAVVVAIIVVLLFWASGGTSSSGTAATSTPGSPVPVSTPPQHELLAQAPLVSIALPITANAVTAIVFRSIPDPAAIELTPTGPLHHYDEGASGNALPDLELDVGAPAHSLLGFCRRDLGHLLEPEDNDDVVEAGLDHAVGYF